MNTRLTLTLATIMLPLTAALCHGEVSVAKVFGDGMVLQRNMPVPVWGTAAPGESVEVTFGDDHEQTTADAAGRWRISLKPMDASAAPRPLTLHGTNTLTLNNILVGEVWICSGQSNMEYPLNRAYSRGMPPPPTNVKDLSTDAWKAANDDGLRIFLVEKNKLTVELPTDGWHPATGEPLGHFSAIGYFFGKQLRDTLKVPVGLIGTYWGGSRIERWTPPDAYASFPSLQAATTRPGIMDGDSVSKYYTTMVAPMAGYSLRGMIWYQGESNLIETNNRNYFDKFAAFAQSWRKAWGEGDFPIGTVQIAPLLYTRRKDPVPHTPETLPELWQLQEEAAEKLPNVGLVPTADIADKLTNIHPWNKWDVGARLANWALATVYHTDAHEWSGPLMEKVSHDDTAVRVSFTHAEGLTGPAGAELSGFELENANHVWVPAKAAKENDGTVRVTAENLPTPRGVRYGWKENAPVGMVNAAGLPAFAFESEW